MSNNTIGKYAVIYVDYGDTCDGYPGMLGIYDTLEEARKEMELDIEGRVKNYNGGAIINDYSGEVWEDKTTGCMWKIVEC